MKKRSRVRYVVLQEYIPASAQKAIKRSVRAVLPRINAPQAFVESLSQDLAIIARRRHAGDAQHILRTYGLVGGSALSVAGGFLLWFFLKKQRDTTHLPVGLTKQSPQSAPMAQV